ncbi:NUDIX domain-containing protein, partial [Nonomuraea sp. RK-328]|nr:NUDIX domain-containing protein [Nonomuraea sp. RK-328]
MVVLPEPRNAVEAVDAERTREILDGPGGPWGRDTPLHLTATALIVHPPTRRVLLRWHSRQHAWILVGGHADPGETDPLTIALREGAEETALADLTPWPDESPLHLVIVAVPAAPHEPAHEHADLRFMLATSSPEAVRPERADAPLRWLTMDEARELTTEANVRETLDRAASLFDAWHGTRPHE